MMYENEHMGILGLSWKEKVAQGMHKNLTAENRKILFGLFWTANTRYIDLLHAKYLEGLKSGIAPGSAVMANHIMSATVNANMATTFVTTLKSFANEGIIDYRLYDPEGYEAYLNLRKDMMPKSPVESALGITKLVAIGAIVIGVGYVLSSAGKFVPAKT
jgi:hypothetical protein